MSLKRLVSMAASVGVVAVSLVAGAGTAGAVGSQGTLHPVDPVRILDTREGLGVPEERTGPLEAGATIELDVTGVGGVPETNVGAVVLNVTVADAADGGFITVFPCGQPRPMASNLNFRGGKIVANQVTAKVGSDGFVCLFASTRANLVADLSGWYVRESGGDKGVFYEQLTPTRIVDTRQAMGDRPAGKLGTEGRLEVKIPGSAAVPSGTVVRAVSMNVTAVGAEEDGFITVFPCDRDRPWVSNVNFVGGAEPVANLVTAKASADGFVCFFASSATHLVVDVQGYFAPVSGTNTIFTPLSPVRVLDTREGLGLEGAKPARAGAGTVIAVKVAGEYGVPVDAKAVLLNVTITEAEGLGFVTAWPCGHPRPLASFLNYTRGVDRANLTPVRIGEGGKVCLFVHEGTEVVADLNGYYCRPV
ncbi:MAG: hypothetical protein ACKV2O_06720 [Acidimicrobiales bacterium]